MRKRFFRSIRISAAALSALAFLGGMAEAIDLRSWDTTISDVAKRFVVLGAFNDQAVLDKETQLLWQRTPGAALATWHNAAGLCLLTSTGGRQGWRLASIHELNTLVDPGPNGLPAGHPFGVSGAPTFWSGTRVADNPTAAYAMDFAFGFPQAELKDVFLPGWCVRGGGQASEY